jgi:hypothetical protein
MAEKARTLYKKADAATLAVLIFEAMLINPAGSATVDRNDDPLKDAACLYKIDAKALRTAVAKIGKEKTQRNIGATRTEGKRIAKARSVHK